MEALILAGGLGSRLGSLTKSKPKSLLPVAGRPFLEWTLENLQRQGIKRFILSTGHLGEQIETYFGTNFRGAPIEYIHEPTPLGTAGALMLALPKIQSENFLVSSGDVYQRISLEELIELHQLHDADATLAVQQSVPKVRSCVAEIQLENKVVNVFRVRRGSRRPSYLLTGTILFRKNALDGISLPLAGEELPMIETHLLPILVKKENVFAKITAAPYLDIGRPENYRTANERLIELSH